MISEAQETTVSLCRTRREIIGLRVLRRLIDLRRPIALGVASMLFVIVGINVAAEYAPYAVPHSVAEQANLTGSGAAAKIEALVALAAGGVAVLLATMYSERRRFAWSAIAACVLGFGVADLFGRHSHGLVFSIVTVGLGLFVIALILHCVRTVPGAVRLAALSGLLALSIPVTEGYEVRATRDPSNYVLVAADEPHAMNASAWRRLWVVRNIQEVSEVVVIALLLQGFLLFAAETTSPAGVAPSSSYQ